MSQVKIATISWNVNGIALCKGGRIERVGSKSCVTPNFVVEIAGKIGEEQDLIVFHTQGEVRSESNFHKEGGVADSIVSILRGQYQRLSYSYSDNFGVLRSLLPDGSRGSKKLSLATSIYIRSGFEHIFHERSWIKNLFSDDNVHSDYDPIQGALATTIKTATHGRLLFLNINLTRKSMARAILRDQEDMSLSSLALMKVMDVMYLSKAKEEQADYIFINGDFNLKSYQLGSGVNSASNDLSLKTLFLGGFMNEFKEGVANGGASFAPTGSLIIGRSEECQKSPESKCYSDINWSQRALYFASSTKGIDCSSYNRFDINAMNYSTNAGVMAFYQIV